MRKNVSSTEWENVGSSSFSPMWTPEKDGEDVIFRPTGNINEMHIKKGKRTQKNFNIECLFVGGNSKSFFVGSKANRKRINISDGDLFTIPMSWALNGENKLAVADDDNKECRLSRLSDLIRKDGVNMRIVFGGKNPIGGGQSVKVFTIQAPKGYKEKVISLTESTTKKRK